MKNLKILFFFTLIFFVSLVSGCSTFNQTLYDRSFNNLMNSAENYIDAQRYPQEVILGLSLLEAEPEYTVYNGFC